MNKYQVNELREYIKKSELVIINENLHIRLSKELLEKYNQGLYDNGLDQMIKHINLINNIGIKYPSNAKPIFYIYIVPDDNFIKLLNYPVAHSKSGGGKPVVSYDLDSFNSAYGISNNLLENRKELNIMQVVNNIHELSHLVHSMFFNKDRFLSEGFAEVLPFYTMDYENVFDEHRNMIKTLTEDQILSAQQLIVLDENSDFNAGVTIPNKSCSFDIAYVSSYLFVRGCLEIVSDKFNLDRVQSTQKFLEIVRQSRYTHQWLVYDIANALGVSQEELLNGKGMQLKIVEELSN